MRRYLLTPVFFLLCGCSAVAFVFAMSLFTGGTLPKRTFRNLRAVRSADLRR